jgi:uncharacterized protein
MGHLWRRNLPFPKACAIRRERVPAPAGWAGKCLLFISDIHYGNFFGPAETASLNTLVRAEQPDGVLLGGDLAEEPKTDLDGFFAHWNPGCPTLFSPGNHDMDHRRESDVERQVRLHNVVLLSNAVVSWRGLTLIGLPSALRARQRLSLLQRPGFKLVLAHEPDTWDWSTEPDLLQLAGHTHGGQVRLFGEPLALPPLGRRYPLGRFSRPGGGQLLVSAGIGCSGVHARVNCPPEICRLDFV